MPTEKGTTMASPNRLPAVGDCYKASLQNAQELTELKNMIESGEIGEQELNGRSEIIRNNEILIRHGWVNTANGKRGHHAWIEIGDFVVETQGGQKNLDSK